MDITHGHVFKDNINSVLPKLSPSKGKAGKLTKFISESNIALISKSTVTHKK